MSKKLFIKVGYLLMIIHIIILFFSCKKNIVTDGLLNSKSTYTLKVNKTAGNGSFSASWNGGMATESELKNGIEIEQGTKVTITAKGEGSIVSLTGTPEFVWNNQVDSLSNKPYIAVMDKDQYIDIDFRIIFFKLSLINKDGGAPITAYWDNILQKSLSIDDLKKIRPGTKIYLIIKPSSGKKCTGLVGIDANSANADNTTATVTVNKDTAVNSFTTYFTMQIDAGLGLCLAYLDEGHLKIANLNEIVPGSNIYLKITPPVGKLINSVAHSIPGSIKTNIDKTVNATIIADVDAKPIRITYKNISFKVTITKPTNLLNKIETYLDATFTKPLLDSSVDENTMLYFKVTAAVNNERLSTNSIVASGSVFNASDFIMTIDRRSATHQIKITQNTTISTAFFKFFKVSITKPTNLLNKIETYLDATFTKPLLDSAVDENTMLYFKITAAAIDEEVDPIPIISSGSALNNGDLKIKDSYKEATHKIRITGNTNISTAFFTAFQFSSTAPYTVTKYTGNARVVTITTDNAGNPITNIGYGAFDGGVYGTGNTTKNMEEVVLPNSIKIIEENGFRFCLKLTTINFPEGLTDIRTSAFWCCEKLNNIVLPTTLRSVATQSFGMGRGIKWPLTNIKIKATTPPSIDQNTSTSVSESFLGIDNNTTIWVPSGSKGTYRSSWYLYEKYIQEY